MVDFPEVPIAKPTLGEQEAEAARRTILSGWVTQGPEVAAFEEEFANAVGAAHACAVSNCTVALHLALTAVGVRPGDEVVTVSHSFVATANSIRYCGAVPVFVDIEPDTLNIDPAAVGKAITERTRAVLCVHQVGMPADLRALLAITRRHGIPLVEDAACAVGSEIQWEGHWSGIGAPHGDVSCFSFHPRKVLTTGDGGMLTTRDPHLDRQFRLLRQHGMTVPDTVRHSASRVVFESYERLGYNYRLTDIQAAVGREQLRRLPEIVERRRSLAARYRELLLDDGELTLQREPSWARTNWQSFAVRLPPDVDQTRVMQLLLDEGIATRRGVMCSHREPAYANEPWRCGAGGHERPCGPGACPGLAESEAAQDATILLPLYHEMTEGDQERVVHALVKALRQRSPARP